MRHGDQVGIQVFWWVGVEGRVEVKISARMMARGK